MGLEGFRQKDVKRAYEDGTAVPALKEGLNDPDAAPYLIKALQEAANEEEAFSALERAVSLLGVKDKHLLNVMINKVMSDLEKGNGLPLDTKEYALVMAGNGANVASIILAFLSAGLAATGVLIGTATLHEGLDRNEKRTTEFKNRLVRLRTALQNRP